MRALPTGTVTFLFTDVEGSTRMWEKSPAEMGTALARHDTLLQVTVERHDGAVFKTVGDGFCAAFHTAADALAAARDAQIAIGIEPWPDAARIKVRMALHTGAADVRDQDYFGQPLNRVARLLSAGYGGQVLLSRATQELVRDSLPVGVALRDMGERRLRDLIRPEHVFQLVAPELPADFPPLKTLDARAHNLPIQSTSFIGRDREMQEVKTLLHSSRLVTLTGSGGAGKTRLSLQVGADLIDDFADGIWFVELAPLVDARLAPQAVASVLGVKEERGAAIAATLTRALANKELLLVLDNCEHLVDAASRLCADLLATCVGVRILATSRESLHVSGETSYRVPSLAAPDPSVSTGTESLTQYAAVQLFIDRALAARPGFRVNNANASAVASICHRLDGIPFALELAAVRVRSLSAEEIDRRLDQRFALLTGGSRTALPRQQTLRALMDWSHDLLTAAEQLLLARLAVFVGGFTLDAAEDVCANAGLGADAMLDQVDALVDKSLVVAEERGGAMRYRLLETVRQYARERLCARGQQWQLQAQHCAHFIALAETADPNLTGPDQKAWLERLETEHDNVRAALSWALKDEVGSGLRLSGALWMFWVVRGHFTEGRRWLAAFIGAAPPERDGNALAKALNGAGALARHQGDYAAARSCFEQCLVLYRQSDNRRGIAAALANLGSVTQSEGDYAPARTLHEESLAIRREFGDRKGIANSLTSLGVIASDQGDYATAWSRQQEALAIYREMGNSTGVARTLNNLGNVAHARGEYPASRALQEESLAIKRSLGDPWGVAASLNNLGNVCRDEGDLATARALHEESLAMRRKIGDRVGVATSLVNLAGLALAARDQPAARASYGEGLTLFRELGDKRGISAALEELGSVALAAASPERAIRIWGGAARLREDARCPMPPNEQADYRTEIDGARATVGDGTFELAWQDGRAMTLDQVIDYALETPNH